MNSNPLLAWIAENFKRLTVKSPSFFKVWKVIMGIPALLVALPAAINVVIPVGSPVHIPEIFNSYVTTIVSWASAVGFWMSFLPTDTKVVGVDQNGTPVKQTDSEKLPFTAQQEDKAVRKDIANRDTPAVPRVNIQK